MSQKIFFFHNPKAAELCSGVHLKAIFSRKNGVQLSKIIRWNMNSSVATTHVFAAMIYTRAIMVATYL